MGIEILFRRETLDEVKVAEGAAHFDSVDLIEDSRGRLGFVALKGGRRVCQLCGGVLLAENSHDRKHRMVPVYMYGMDTPAVWLHAKCEAPPAKIFMNFQGLGIRRKFAQGAKALSKVVGG